MRMSKRADNALFALAVAFLVGVLLFAVTRSPGGNSPAAAPTSPITTTTNPPDATTSTPAVEMLEAVIIGDSYVGGQPERWPTTVFGEMDDVRFSVNGFGGSGYVMPGSGRPYGERVAEAVSSSTDVVIVFGSRNDIRNPDGVQSAARDVYAEIAGIAPDARLIVVAPPWVDENYPAAITQIRDALQAEALAARAVFVDPIADGWFFDDDGTLIGDDGVHPTSAGHDYMAARIEPVVDAAISDLLAG